MYIFGQSVKHERNVYSVLDLLGDLGGVMEVLMIIFGTIFISIAEYSFVLKAS